MNSQQRKSLEAFIGNSVLVWPPKGRGQGFKRYDVVLVKRHARNDSDLLAPTNLNLKNLPLTLRETNMLQLCQKPPMRDSKPKRWEQALSKGFTAGLAAGIEGATASLDGAHRRSDKFCLSLGRQVIENVDISVRDTIEKMMKDRDRKLLATIMKHCKAVPNEGENTRYVGIVIGVHKAKISVSGEKTNDFGAAIRAMLQFGGGLEGKARSEASLAFESEGVVGVNLLVFPVREKDVRLPHRGWGSTPTRKYFLIQKESQIDSTALAKQLRWDTTEKTYIETRESVNLNPMGELVAQITMIGQFTVKVAFILAVLWLVFQLMFHLRELHRPPQPEPNVWVRFWGGRNKIFR